MAGAMLLSPTSTSIAPAFCLLEFPCTSTNQRVVHLLMSWAWSHVTRGKNPQAYTAGSACIDFEIACNKDVFPDPERPVTSRPGTEDDVQCDCIHFPGVYSPPLTLLPKAWTRKLVRQNLSALSRTLWTPARPCLVCLICL